ncbi:MAG: ferredoxin-thioredoxin reductase catalytic domain-containing protein [Candidatus Hermodarchaeota archaeon]
MDMKTKEGMLEYCKKVCEKNGWILNKDQETLNDLLDGLVDNKKNYDYQSCPCRLASSNRDLDRDLICPCDYSPLDIKEYGACYCNLYMRSDYYETIGKEYIKVPERRPIEKEKATLDYINEQLEK